MTRTFLAGILCLLLSTAAGAQEKPPEKAEPKPVPDQATLFKQFEETLKDAKLVGRFTLFGKEDRDPIREEYTIKSVRKLDDGDYWLFNARIKYGDKDVTLPLPLEVKWAGDTPVITLTDFTIPGMGTFSSRVMIYRDSYAGWWKHGDAGGHLFGRIERAKEEEKDK